MISGKHTHLGILPSLCSLHEMFSHIWCHIQWLDVWGYEPVQIYVFVLVMSLRQTNDNQLVTILETQQGCSKLCVCLHVCIHLHVCVRACVCMCVCLRLGGRGMHIFIKAYVCWMFASMPVTYHCQFQSTDIKNKRIFIQFLKTSHH